MDKIVKFNDVTFKYDETTPLIDNLNLSIKKGKYTVLLGPNGSGKSTIAKLIMGLLEKNSGNITIWDKELNDQNLDVIRNEIAIVFQNPDNQFIGSTVEDDIAFGLENRCVESSKMQDIIEEYARKVSMQDFLKSEPSALSGGQKQRVAIAGAIALNPTLLILDEATSMLDPKGKKEINKVIYEIKKNNKDMAILSITHHIDEALLADEIIVLNKGKVVKVGTPKEILYDEKLLIDNNLITPFVVEVRQALAKENINIEESFSLEELVEKL